MSTNKLKALVSEASPEEFAHGTTWYVQACEEAHTIAQVNGLSLGTVCQVIAILSPGVKWARNLRDASNLCKAYALGLSPDGVQVCTYGANKAKAWRVLQGSDSLKPTAQKTYNFYMNILNPRHASHITIDRHAAKAYKGKESGGKEVITKLQYEKIGRAYVRAAKDLGLTPAALQAIVWLVYKRKVNR